MPTFGRTAAGGSSFPCSGDRALASRFELLEDGDVTSITVFVDGAGINPGCNVKAMVYSDGAGPLPANLLATSPPQFVANAEAAVEFTLSSALPLTAGFYWLAVVTDSFELRMNCTSGAGLKRREGHTYASPAALWTTDNNGADGLDIFATYTVPAPPAEQEAQVLVGPDGEMVVADGFGVVVAVL